MKWYSRITPFVIICSLAVMGMLFFLLAERDSPAEVRYKYLVLLLPIILGMVVVDLVLRYIIKQKLWLWVIEIVLLFTVIYYWIVSDM